MRFFLILYAGGLAAQSLSFDAASIRKISVSSPGEERRGPRIIPRTGGINARASLRDLIQWAWNLRDYQLVGPDWITTEQYEVTARAAGPSTIDDLRAMSRLLLTDRFRLALRKEHRENSILALVVTRGQAKLTPSTRPEQGTSRLPGGGLRLRFERTSMAQLAEFLSTLVAVGHPVEDATGLTEAYDFDLDLREAVGPWASDSERQAAPSVSTVLQEQLGLRFEPRRSAVETYIVQRAERPSEN